MIGTGVATAQNHAQKKIKRKYKRNKCRHRRIDKSEQAPGPLAAPTGLPPTKPITPKCRYRNNTFKKECDDDDAAA